MTAPTPDKLPQEIYTAMEQLHDFLFLAAPPNDPATGAFNTLAQYLGWREP